jgi:hypothetical protein
MKNTFSILVRKLVVLAVMSMATFGQGAKPVSAHEVLPTIADLATTPEGRVTLEMRINLEAFLAGIDLDVVEDTDAADAAADYDSLRALPAEEVLARVPDLVAGWSAHPLLEAGAPLDLRLVDAQVPEDLDLELPRITILSLAADLPEGAQAITLNWPAGSGALVLRQQGVAAPFTGYVDGGQSSPAIALAGGDAQTAGEAFWSYVPVGFDHILPKGLDHILFVLGLFFLSTNWRPLLFQVTAFTLAHTVTLALGALGLVTIPGSIVEPLIAASIVYVAVENVFMRGLSRWRPLVIFGFGLLHGLGFASVLGEFGLPEDQFIPALIGFNVGVEIGQLTVIALAALLLAFCVQLAKRSELSPAELPVGSYPVMFRAVSIPASLVIALIGAYWTVERVFF